MVPDGTQPDASGWERPLRSDDFLLWESRAAGDDGQRLALYALAAAQTAEERGLEAVFGDLSDVGSTITAENGRIRLNGYAFTQETQPNGELLLTLRWESLQPVENNYHVFVHILNETNDKVDQRDGQPVQWMRPTSSWQPGERSPTITACCYRPICRPAAIKLASASMTRSAANVCRSTAALVNMPSN
ncbi:MAG: hypothetical protein R2911_13180 [Caldilineaceae bacterium]